LRENHASQSDHLSRELRLEIQTQARESRQEFAQTLSTFQQTMLLQIGENTRTQNSQIDLFQTQVTGLQQTVSRTLQQVTLQLTDQLRLLSQGNEQSLKEVRQTVEQRLMALQLDNEKKLEQMRQTVDEKLHATLEQRLGESFKQVAERLEQVHHGLGEMQTLAQGVGDLKRVLTNVKSRGIFGEIQLARLLEQVFTPDQYAANVITVPGSNERVEFAIRLPGRLDDGQPVWLPLDAKFPREDYERLIDALDRAEREPAEIAAKALEQRIRDEAKMIAAKYLSPPHTTDFAVLFLPTEGLYAELLRRPGLMESLQRDHRVTLAGPTTLLAMLNSLHVGFRTLALEKRSSEVWKVLGAVKTEFAKFGEALVKTKKKLEEASSNIELVERRARVMTRELRSVEALPDDAAATQLLSD
jgi:DNA recombination protein RmuC